MGLLCSSRQSVGAPTSIKDLLPSFPFTPMMQQQTKRAEKRDSTGKTAAS